MAHAYPVRILGTGAYLPREQVTSTALDERHGRSAGSSEARSGVATRHYAGLIETSSYMATQALSAALAASGLAGTDLDLLLAASAVPEQPMPTNAVLVQRALGLGDSGIPCFDVNASCLGFLSALEIATLGIAAGRYRRVAIVASELASKGLNGADTETSSLFGDSTVDALRFATYSRGAYLCKRGGGEDQRGAKRDHHPMARTPAQALQSVCLSNTRHLVDADAELE